MLLSLANHLLVSLSKNNIAIIYRSGFANRVLKSESVNLGQDDGLDIPQMIFKLERALDQLNLPAKTCLSVTLSSDMVRYLTLPATFMTMNEAEKVAYATAAYQEVYGFATAEWMIKCHDAPPNQAMLTSAVDHALLEAIEKLAVKYQFKLKSIQPYLMTAFNALHDSLKHADALFAVLEPNRILLVNLKDGFCTQVKTYHRGVSWKKTLSQILARESMLNDDDIRNVLVYAPGQVLDSFPVRNDWLLKTIAIKKSKVLNVDEGSMAMLEALV